MKRIILAAAALTAVSISWPVAAADMPARVAKAPAPVAAPLFNWSGFYGGVYAGYQWGEFTEDQDDQGDIRGWALGGLAGWNYQTGNWVWGFEGDVGWSRTKGGNETAGGNMEAGDIKTVANARLRLGIASDRLLWFIAGGPSWARLRMDHNSGTPDGTSWVRGWTLGGGVDWAWTNDMILRLEYLYADYREKTFGFPTISAHEHDIGLGPVHTVRAAAIWRFATGKYPVGKTPVAPAPVVTKY